jgi:hypothetical protein
MLPHMDEVLRRRGERGYKLLRHDGLEGGPGPDYVSSVFIFNYLSILQIFIFNYLSILQIFIFNYLSILQIFIFNYLSILQINPIRPSPSHYGTENQSCRFSANIFSRSALTGGRGGESVLGGPVWTYTECPLQRVPERGSFIAQRACNRRDIP